jgi:hypothetical protein
MAVLEGYSHVYILLTEYRVFEEINFLLFQFSKSTTNFFVTSRIHNA